MTSVLSSKNPDRAKPVHLQQVMADLALWCALVAMLQLFRGILLAWFVEQMAPGTKPLQIARCFAAGLRFDISIASYAVLPAALCSIVGFWRPLGGWHQRVRRAVIGLASLICIGVFITDIAYFKEYQNQFDHWVFELGYDDRRAIALTIWKSYPVVWLGITMLALALAVGWLLREWTGWVARRPCLPEALSRGWWRALWPMLLTAALVFGMRGSLGRRPVQLKDAGVCGDTLLDKLVPNPFSAFRYAWTQHRLISRGPGLNTILPDGDVRRAARMVCAGAADSGSLDDCLRRTAAGPRGERPRHIFLVVMESYDAWPMQPEFRALHLTDQLLELGRSGLRAEAFVSAGSGTMACLSTLIAGLPEVGLHVNYQPSLRQGIPTATARIFKRLGYRTRFFYGGYPSWQRLGDFCREQGFDEVHGGALMSERLTGNEWGVADKVLFEFILKTVGEEPSFNVVMSTSCHPPFSVNLAAEGFPLKALPREFQQYRASADDLRVLGHLWYADRCLGSFVTEAVRRFPRPLFAITGDHFSRRCLNPRPTLYQRKAVPFVLYGPGVLPPLPSQQRLVGSHLDIVPTLIELAAPRGFSYQTFGRNLLDASQEQIGFGNNVVVTPDFILDVQSASGPEWLSRAPDPNPVAASALRERYRQLHALGWWRVVRGSSF